MRALLAAALLLLLAAPSATAQDPDERAVLDVLERLFDGMRARDTAALRGLFTPETRFLGVDPAGTVQATPPDGWLRSLAASPQVWHEVPRRPEVRVDGGIATIWTYYDFYLGARFSHCGHDALQLIRTAAGWRIVSLMDTRLREGCRT